MALVMISPSLLPKAAISIGAGSPLSESERSGLSRAARCRKSFFCDRFAHALKRRLRRGL
jgi:hypothetical protein